VSQLKRLTRASGIPEIFATKAQRHKGFFVILSWCLGAFVAKRKKFATKSTKFTIKKLKPCRGKIFGLSRTY
jgi:hypothetical protein